MRINGIKQIVGLSNKTVVENIVGVIAKVRKPIVNKPGSRDKTRQAIVVKDNSGTMDVLVWGGNWTNDVIGKSITIKSGMVSEFRGKKRLTAFDRNVEIKKPSNLPKKETKYQEEKKYSIGTNAARRSLAYPKQNYIPEINSEPISTLSNLLVKCFDAVYKELKKAGYNDISLEEIGKMARAVFLEIMNYE